MTKLQKTLDTTGHAPTLSTHPLTRAGPGPVKAVRWMTFPAGRSSAVGSDARAGRSTCGSGTIGGELAGLPVNSVWNLPGVGVDREFTASALGPSARAQGPVHGARSSGGVPVVRVAWRSCGGPLAAALRETGL